MTPRRVSSRRRLRKGNSRLDQPAKDPREPMPAAPEAMKAWWFSTSTLPVAERRQGWREVMMRLRLPLSEPPEHDPFRGEVSGIVSPLGMDFAVMSASPQAISGRNPNQPAAGWLVVLPERGGPLLDGRPPAPPAVEDIGDGPPAV